MAIANNIPRQERAKQVPSKPLGQYLIEAGLLSDAQVHVALTDQQVTGMRFGEVVVARGWMKEQTVEYLMKKVVVPERKRIEARQMQVKQQLQKRQHTLSQQHTLAQESQVAAENDSAQADFRRKEPPIAKPLPSVNSVDSDVSWVG